MASRSLWLTDLWDFIRGHDEEEVKEKKKRAVGKAKKVWKKKTFGKGDSIDGEPGSSDQLDKEADRISVQSSDSVSPLLVAPGTTDEAANSSLEATDGLSMSNLPSQDPKDDLSEGNPVLGEVCPDLEKHDQYPSGESESSAVPSDESELNQKLLSGQEQRKHDPIRIQFPKFADQSMSAEYVQPAGIKNGVRRGPKEGSIPPRRKVEPYPMQEKSEDELVENQGMVPGEEGVCGRYSVDVPILQKGQLRDQNNQVYSVDGSVGQVQGMPPVTLNLTISAPQYRSSKHTPDGNRAPKDRRTSEPCMGDQLDQSYATSERRASEDILEETDSVSAGQGLDRMLNRPEGKEDTANNNDSVGQDLRDDDQHTIGAEDSVFSTHAVTSQDLKPAEMEVDQEFDDLANRHLTEDNDLEKEFDSLANRAVPIEADHNAGNHEDVAMQQDDDENSEVAPKDEVTLLTKRQHPEGEDAISPKKPHLSNDDQPTGEDVLDNDKADTSALSDEPSTDDTYLASTGGMEGDGKMQEDGEYPHGSQSGHLQDNLGWDENQNIPGELEIGEDALMNELGTSAEKDNNDEDDIHDDLSKLPSSQNPDLIDKANVEAVSPDEKVALQRGVSQDPQNFLLLDPKPLSSELEEVLEGGSLSEIAQGKTLAPREKPIGNEDKATVVEGVEVENPAKDESMEGSSLDQGVCEDGVTDEAVQGTDSKSPLLKGQRQDPQEYCLSGQTDTSQELQFGDSMHVFSTGNIPAGKAYSMVQPAPKEAEYSAGKPIDEDENQNDDTIDELNKESSPQESGMSEDANAADQSLLEKAALQRGVSQDWQDFNKSDQKPLSAELGQVLDGISVGGTIEGKALVLSEKPTNDKSSLVDDDAEVENQGQEESIESFSLDQGVCEDGVTDEAVQQTDSNGALLKQLSQDPQDYCLSGQTDTSQELQLEDLIHGFSAGNVPSGKSYSCVQRAPKEAGYSPATPIDEEENQFDDTDDEPNKESSPQELCLSEDADMADQPSQEKAALQRGVSQDWQDFNKSDQKPLSAELGQVLDGASVGGTIEGKALVPREKPTNDRGALVVDDGEVENQGQDESVEGLSLDQGVCEDGVTDEAVQDTDSKGPLIKQQSQDPQDYCLSGQSYTSQGLQFDNAMHGFTAGHIGMGEGFSHIQPSEEMAKCSLKTGDDGEIEQDKTLASDESKVDSDTHDGHADGDTNLKEDIVDGMSKDITLVQDTGEVVIAQDASIVCAVLDHGNDEQYKDVGPTDDDAANDDDPLRSTFAQDACGMECTLDESIVQDFVEDGNPPSTVSIQSGTEGRVMSALVESGGEADNNIDTAQSDGKTKFSLDGAPDSYSAEDEQMLDADFARDTSAVDTAIQDSGLDQDTGDNLGTIHTAYGEDPGDVEYILDSVLAQSANEDGMPSYAGDDHDAGDVEHIINANALLQYGQDREKDGDTGDAEFDQDNDEAEDIPNIAQDACLNEHVIDSASALDMGISMDNNFAMVGEKDHIQRAQSQDPQEYLLSDESSHMLHDESQNQEISMDLSNEGMVLVQKGGRTHDGILEIPLEEEPERQESQSPINGVEGDSEKSSQLAENQQCEEEYKDSVRHGQDPRKSQVLLDDSTLIEDTVFPGEEISGLAASTVDGRIHRKRLQTQESQDYLVSDEISAEDLESGQLGQSIAGSAHIYTGQERVITQTEAEQKLDSQPIIGDDTDANSEQPLSDDRELGEDLSSPIEKEYQESIDSDDQCLTAGDKPRSIDGLHQETKDIDEQDLEMPIDGDNHSASNIDDQGLLTKPEEMGIPDGDEKLFGADDKCRTGDESLSNVDDLRGKDVDGQGPRENEERLTLNEGDQMTLGIDDSGPNDDEEPADVKDQTPVENDDQSATVAIESFILANKDTAQVDFDDQDPTGDKESLTAIIRDQTPVDMVKDTEIENEESGAANKDQTPVDKGDKGPTGDEESLTVNFRDQMPLDLVENAVTGNDESGTGDENQTPVDKDDQGLTEDEKQLNQGDVPEPAESVTRSSWGQDPHDYKLSTDREIKDCMEIEGEAAHIVQGRSLGPEHSLPQRQEQKHKELPQSSIGGIECEVMPAKVDKLGREISARKPAGKGEFEDEVEGFNSNSDDTPMHVDDQLSSEGCTDEIQTHGLEGNMDFEHEEILNNPIDGDDVIHGDDTLMSNEQLGVYEEQCDEKVHAMDKGLEEISELAEGIVYGAHTAPEPEVDSQDISDGGESGGLEPSTILQDVSCQNSIAMIDSPPETTIIAADDNDDDNKNSNDDDDLHKYHDEIKHPTIIASEMGAENDKQQAENGDADISQPAMENNEEVPMLDDSLNAVPVMENNKELPMKDDNLDAAPVSEMPSASQIEVTSSGPAEMSSGGDLTGEEDKDTSMPFIAEEINTAQLASHPAVSQADQETPLAALRQNVNRNQDELHDPETELLLADQEYRNTVSPPSNLKQDEPRSTDISVTTEEKLGTEEVREIAMDSTNNEYGVPIGTLVAEDTVNTNTIPADTATNKNQEIMQNDDDDTNNGNTIPEVKDTSLTEATPLSEESVNTRPRDELKETDNEETFGSAIMDSSVQFPDGNIERLESRPIKRVHEELDFPKHEHVASVSEGDPHVIDSSEVCKLGAEVPTIVDHREKDEKNGDICQRDDILEKDRDLDATLENLPIRIQGHYSTEFACTRESIPGEESADDKNDASDQPVILLPTQSTATCFVDNYCETITVSPKRPCVVHVGQREADQGEMQTHADNAKQMEDTHGDTKVAKRKVSPDSCLYDEAGAISRHEQEEEIPSNVQGRPLSDQKSVDDGQSESKSELTVADSQPGGTDDKARNTEQTEETSNDNETLDTVKFDISPIEKVSPDEHIGTVLMQSLCDGNNDDTTTIDGVERSDSKVLGDGNDNLTECEVERKDLTAVEPATGALLYSQVVKGYGTTPLTHKDDEDGTAMGNSNDDKLQGDDGMEMTHKKGASPGDAPLHVESTLEDSSPCDVMDVERESLNKDAENEGLHARKDIASDDNLKEEDIKMAHEKETAIGDAPLHVESKLDNSLPCVITHVGREETPNNDAEEEELKIKNDIKKDTSDDDNLKEKDIEITPEKETDKNEIVLDDSSPCDITYASSTMGTDIETTCEVLPAGLVLPTEGEPIIDGKPTNENEQIARKPSTPAIIVTCYSFDQQASSSETDLSWDEDDVEFYMAEESSDVTSEPHVTAGQDERVHEPEITKTTAQKTAESSAKGSSDELKGSQEENERDTANVTDVMGDIQGGLSADEGAKEDMSLKDPDVKKTDDEANQSGDLEKSPGLGIKQTEEKVDNKISSPGAKYENMDKEDKEVNLQENVKAIPVALLEENQKVSEKAERNLIEHDLRVSELRDEGKSNLSPDTGIENDAKPLESGNEVKQPVTYDLTDGIKEVDNKATKEGASVSSQTDSPPVDGQGPMDISSGDYAYTEMYMETVTVGTDRPTIVVTNHNDGIPREINTGKNCAEGENKTVDPQEESGGSTSEILSKSVQVLGDPSMKSQHERDDEDDHCKEKENVSASVSLDKDGKKNEVIPPAEMKGSDILEKTDREVEISASEKTDHASVSLDKDGKKNEVIPPAEMKGSDILKKTDKEAEFSASEKTDHASVSLGKDGKKNEVIPPAEMKGSDIPKKTDKEVEISASEKTDHASVSLDKDGKKNEVIPPAEIKGSDILEKTDKEAEFSSPEDIDHASQTLDNQNKIGEKPEASCKTTAMRELDLDVPKESTDKNIPGGLSPDVGRDITEASESETLVASKIDSSSASDLSDENREGEKDDIYADEHRNKNRKLEDIKDEDSESVLPLTDTPPSLGEETWVLSPKDYAYIEKYMETFSMSTERPTIIFTSHTHGMPISNSSEDDSSDSEGDGGPEKERQMRRKHKGHSGSGKAGGSGSGSDGAGTSGKATESGRQRVGSDPQSTDAPQDDMIKSCYIDGPSSSHFFGAGENQDDDESEESISIHIPSNEGNTPAVSEEENNSLSDYEGEKSSVSKKEGEQTNRRSSCSGDSLESDDDDNGGSLPKGNIGEVSGNSCSEDSLDLRGGNKGVNGDKFAGKTADQDASNSGSTSDSSNSDQELAVSNPESDSSSQSADSDKSGEEYIVSSIWGDGNGTNNRGLANVKEEEEDDENTAKMADNSGEGQTSNNDNLDKRQASLEENNTDAVDKKPDVPASDPAESIREESHSEEAAVILADREVGSRESRENIIGAAKELDALRETVIVEQATNNVRDSSGSIPQASNMQEASSRDVVVRGAESGMELDDSPPVTIGFSSEEKVKMAQSMNVQESGEREKSGPTQNVETLGADMEWNKGMKSGMKFKDSPPSAERVSTEESVEMTQSVNVQESGEREKAAQTQNVETINANMELERNGGMKSDMKFKDSPLNTERVSAEDDIQIAQSVNVQESGEREKAAHTQNVETLNENMELECEMKERKFMACESRQHHFDDQDQEISTTSQKGDYGDFEFPKNSTKDERKDVRYVMEEKGDKKKGNEVNAVTEGNEDILEAAENELDEVNIKHGDIDTDNMKVLESKGDKLNQISDEYYQDTPQELKSTVDDDQMIIENQNEEAIIKEGNYEEENYPDNSKMSENKVFDYKLEQMKEENHQDEIEKLEKKGDENKVKMKIGNDDDKMKEEKKYHESSPENINELESTGQDGIFRQEKEEHFHAEMETMAKKDDDANKRKMDVRNDYKIEGSSEHHENDHITSDNQPDKNKMKIMNGEDNITKQEECLTDNMKLENENEEENSESGIKYLENKHDDEKIEMERNVKYEIKGYIHVGGDVNMERVEEEDEKDDDKNMEVDEEGEKEEEKEDDGNLEKIEENKDEEDDVFQGASERPICEYRRKLDKWVSCSTPPLSMCIPGRGLHYMHTI